MYPGSEPRRDSWGSRVTGWTLSASPPATSATAGMWVMPVRMTASTSWWLAAARTVSPEPMEWPTRITRRKAGPTLPARSCPTTWCTVAASAVASSSALGGLLLAPVPSRSMAKVAYPWAAMSRW